MIFNLFNETREQFVDVRIFHIIQKYNQIDFNILGAKQKQTQNKTLKLKN